MKRIIPVALVLLTLTNSVASAQPDPDEFQSRAAISAIKSYLKDIDRAKTEYDKVAGEAKKEYQEQEADARKDLIKGLEAALKREIDRKNLKESVKLQETIDELENAKPSKPGQPQIVGTWRIEWPDKPSRFQTFSLKSGEVLIERRDSLGGPVTDRGMLQLDNGTPIFKYRNGARLDRYSVLSDGRILVEIWDLTKDSQATGQPYLLGVATRVEE